MGSLEGTQWSSLNWYSTQLNMYPPYFQACLLCTDAEDFLENIDITYLEELVELTGEEGRAQRSHPISVRPTLMFAL
jgi:hypothetical protein